MASASFATMRRNNVFQSSSSSVVAVTIVASLTLITLTCSFPSSPGFATVHRNIQHPQQQQQQRPRQQHASLLVPPLSMGGDVRDEVFSFGGDGDDEDGGEEGSDGGDVLLFSSEWDENGEAPVNKQQFEKQARWHGLDQNVKDIIIKEGQQRAIANKKKREPSADKKRRLLKVYQEAQAKDKQKSRVRRPLALFSPERTPLRDVEIGSVRNGTVISLTNFGAYVDVGTECDGLLHISQMSRASGDFVAHPRQVLTPGQEVHVTVTRTDPESKKMQLTMLTEEERRADRMYDDDEEEEDDDDEREERIPLEDVFLDDELWGEIKRVTNFGAFVELGADVDGFLHFMDHPLFGVVRGAHPSEYMEKGQRVRVWVSNVDQDLKRIKLTAQRPSSLPVLRRS